jgi:SAM-dependent methyltransferase
MLYDTIGKQYASRRIPDPRIEAHIRAALEGADSIVNVGAGTGSYEPIDRPVVAVEPSMTMIRQRSRDAAPAIQAVAERLPLRDRCTSAATAFLTLHHWADLQSGLKEMKRISRKLVAILTWDPAAPTYWLTDEYFPAFTEMDRQRFPALSEISEALGHTVVHPVPVPADCIDGFLGAYWRRPHAYLDPGIRQGMSGFVDLPGLEDGLRRLRDDLASGHWHNRFGHLLRKESLDIGYRLVTATVQ